MDYASVASGVEAATVAWGNISGWKPKWFSQYDPDHNYETGPDFPSRVLKHHYPGVPNLGDMLKLETNETFIKSQFDLLVGGTPCFPADTMVICKRGVIPISEVTTTDYVLTHTGSYRKVMKTGSKLSDTVSMQGSDGMEIITTAEHPFYRCVRDNDTVSFEWEEARHMTRKLWCFHDGSIVQKIPYSGVK